MNVGHAAEVGRAKRYAEGGLDYVQYEIERVISRRIMEDRINGYTLEMAQEIAAVARSALLTQAQAAARMIPLEAIEEALKPSPMVIAKALWEVHRGGEPLPPQDHPWHDGLWQSTYAVVAAINEANSPSPQNPSKSR